MKTRLSGPVKLDWRLVADIAKDIANKFESCGVISVKPARYESKPVQINDRTIRVYARPGRVTHGSAQTFVTKGEKISVYIDIEGEKDLCIAKPIWRAKIFEILAHEMSHAVDPATLKIKREPDFNPGGQYCKYANLPTEIAAFINTVKADLITKTGRDNEFLSVNKNVTKHERLLYQSVTWKKIGHCYSDKTRKRFLKMVATNFEKTADGWRVKD